MGAGRKRQGWEGRIMTCAVICFSYKMEKHQGRSSAND